MAGENGAQRGTQKHLLGRRCRFAILPETEKTRHRALRPGPPHVTAPQSSAHHLASPLPTHSPPERAESRSRTKGSTPRANMLPEGGSPCITPPRTLYSGTRAEQALNAVAFT
eukprot:4599196-Pyramimonas_sp.AAC.1